MLREFKKVRQEKDSFRRLFYDDFFDLYYWYTQDKSVITGFQMIYSVNDAKMALTFETGKKLKIHAIESDDRMVSHSPILNGKGIFLPQQIRKEFEERSSNIEPQLIEYVLDVLKDC